MPHTEIPVLQMMSTNDHTFHYIHKPFKCLHNTSSSSSSPLLQCHQHHNQQQQQDQRELHLLYQQKQHQQKQQPHLHYHHENLHLHSYPSNEINHLPLPSENYIPLSSAAININSDSVNNDGLSNNITILENIINEKNIQVSNEFNINNCHSFNHILPVHHKETKHYQFHYQQHHPFHQQHQHHHQVSEQLSDSHLNAINFQIVNNNKNIDDGNNFCSSSINDNNNNATTTATITNTTTTTTTNNSNNYNNNNNHHNHNHNHNEINDSNILLNSMRGDICNLFDNREYCVCDICTNKYDNKSNDMKKISEWTLVLTRLYQYLPFIIVATVLFISIGLVIGASVIYIKYLSLDIIYSSNTDTSSCIKECNNNMAPVCGSNGILYDNECLLQRESCLSSRYIDIVNINNCYNCTISKCDSDTNCPSTCPKIDSPICGTDGITYENLCTLRKAECNTKKTIEIFSNGVCDICNNIQCKYGARCENGYCICPIDCPLTFEPVCSNRGITYPNECEMRSKSCDENIEQTIAFYGECEEIDEEKISNKNTDTSIKDDNDNNGDVMLRAIQEINKYNSDHNNDEYNEDNYNNLINPLNKSNSLAHLIKSSCDECCDDCKCKCNKLGSLKCIDGQCICKKGVGGEICDRCEHGYWGLHKIQEGAQGCTPCDCNLNGSVRDDCEQMTGRCVCKHGLDGIKCDNCPQGTALQTIGCIHVSLTHINSGSCNTYKCKFGATCVTHPDGVQCVCLINCSIDASIHNYNNKLLDEEKNNHHLKNEQYYDDLNIEYNDHLLLNSNEFDQITSDNSDNQNNADDFKNTPVCGSDGNTYKSHCSLLLFACTMQYNVYMVHKGECHHTQAYVEDERYTREISSSSTVSPEINNYIPMFTSNSYITLPSIGSTKILSLEFNITFYADNGLILYSSHHYNHKDFILLAIVDGYIQFHYDLGSGEANLCSLNQIQLGTPTIINASQSSQNGILIVSDSITYGTSKGYLTALDTSIPLFIGGIPKQMHQRIKLFKNLHHNNNKCSDYNSNDNDNDDDDDNDDKFYTGLKGCVHSFKLNNNIINLTSYDLFNIKNCSDNICMKKSCSKNICIPLNDKDFICNCNLMDTKNKINNDNDNHAQQDEVQTENDDYYENGYCRKDCPVLCFKESNCARINNTLECFCGERRCSEVTANPNDFIYNFLYNSYITLPNNILNNGKIFVIEARLYPRDGNGLILNNGDIKLYLENRFVIFSFTLYSHFNNSSKKQVILNKWYKIHITREREFGTLKVNDCLKESSEIKIVSIKDDHHNLSNLLEIGKGFNGAIERIVINGENINITRKAITMYNITKFNMK